MACWFLLGALSSRRAAGAESEKAIASRFFQAGVVAFERADFVGAAGDFDEANRHLPSSQAMVNAARSWRAAGADARAADEYAAALEIRSLSVSDSATVRGELDELEQGLGILRVTFPVGGFFSVDHAMHSPIPRAVHLRPGAYAVDVEGPDGTHVRRPVFVKLGAVESLEAPLPPTASTASHEPTGTAPLVPSGGGSSWMRTAGWIWLGSAAGFAATAGAAGYLGLQARDRFDMSGDTNVAAHDQAATLRTLANVGWIACGAAAATGTALLLWPLSSSVSSPVQSARSVLITPVGLAVRATF
jgi:hypothetical protein